MICYYGCCSCHCFQYTSPKFHKPVFSDYRQLPAFKENYEYIYFSISCSPASISDTFLHNQTKTSSIEMVTLDIKGSGFGTTEKEYEFCSTFCRRIFSMGESHYTPSNRHIGKKSCQACQELVSYHGI
jgi:hypothetical protein